MAAGTFPIVSDIPANSAWLKDGQTGFLHKTGDAQNFADCILEYINQPEIVSSALQMNRSLVEKEGDRTVNMTKLENIYKSLVDNKSNAPNVLGKKYRAVFNGESGV
jgi:glycosyltransferase involved in cell wall biosynthesis